MKLYAVLAAAGAVIIAIGIMSIALVHTHHANSRHASSRLPGIAVNLVACAASGGKAECLAVYKGKCALISFDSQLHPAGAQPVDKKYCGQ